MLIVKFFVASISSSLFDNVAGIFVYCNLIIKVYSVASFWLKILSSLLLIFPLACSYKMLPLSAKGNKRCRVVFTTSLVLVYLCGITATVTPPFSDCSHGDYKHADAVNNIDQAVFAHLQESGNLYNGDDQNYAISSHGIVEIIKAMTVLFREEDRNKVLDHIRSFACDKKKKESKKSARKNSVERHAFDRDNNRNYNDNNTETLQEATRIWLDSNTKVNNGILKQHKDILKRIKISSGNLNEACKAINKWVAKHTLGMIKDLVKPGQGISTDSKIIVTNALAFQGKWKQPFQVERTRLMDFKLLESGKDEEGETCHDCKSSSGQSRGQVKKLKVKMMVGTVKADYYHGDLFDMAELPYEGGRYSMVLIVPSTSSSIDSEENEEDIPSPHSKKHYYLKALRVLQSPRSKRRRNVKLQVFLPKFKVKSSFKLKKILAAVGFGHLFISPLNTQGDSLRFGEVLHQSAVEVDEKGTKASAGSAGVASRSFPMRFIVDRPFQFLIRDTKSEVIMFHGNIGKPEYD